MCSMKSVIDRYGKAKEEQQVAANPNSELQVCYKQVKPAVYYIPIYIHPKVFACNRKLTVQPAKYIEVNYY
jgi:hypothetical protein